MMRTLFIILLMLVSSSAYSSIIMLGTRVIYPETAKSVDINLRNNADSSFIVQSWVSKQPTTDTSSIEPTFFISPPVVRIYGKTRQKLKLAFTRSTALPADRESVFYFNFLEVPYEEAVKSNKEPIQNGSKMSLTILNRVKIFYRPKSVNSRPESSDINVDVKAIKEGNKVTIRYTNNSPYYLSMSGKAELEVSDNKFLATETMIAPLSYHDFSFSGVTHSDNNGKLKLHLINDFSISEEVIYDVKI